MVIMQLSPDRLEMPFGGVGVQLARLMPHLSRGNDITIIGPGPAPAAPPETHRYLPILERPILQSYITTSGIQHLLQAAYTDAGWYAASAWGRPDLIHATDSQTAFAGIILARRFGVPLFFTVQLSYWLMAEQFAPLTDVDQRAVQMAYEIEAAAIREASGVMMVSRAYHERFARAFPDQAHKFHLIPNGVDLPETHYPKSERLTVGYIGRCSEQKGVSEMLDAILSEDWPEGVQLRWAGGSDGGSAELWGHVIQTAYYYPERLELVGYLQGEAKARFLQECHVGLFPSRHEPFGIVGLEWMAVGTPLVTTGVDGIGDYADESCSVRIGLSPSEICAGIHQALERPEIAVQARARASQFKWSEIAEKVLEMYVEGMS